MNREAPMYGMIKGKRLARRVRPRCGPRGGLTAVLLAGMLVFGCATEQKTVQKDPFFEKWTTMAETATGHSAAPRERAFRIPEEMLKGDKVTPEEQAVADAKRLPTQPVSLKMRQADVKTVLRALARIAQLNILVKNEIKGETTIDFQQVPWNQAFTSLLRTQNLTYVWEGEVIRALTLEDMEQDLKRKT